MTTYSYSLSVDELELDVLRGALKGFMAECTQRWKTDEDFDAIVERKLAQAMLDRLIENRQLASQYIPPHRARRPDDAVFSPCRTYRYALKRVWDASKPLVMFIGLNPSTADETKDDPTIRRCINYAKSWGYGGLYMANLFAYCTSDPRVMKTAQDPVGPENDQWIDNLASKADLIVAIWGNEGQFNHRSDHIRKMLPDMTCLKMNKGGEPAHPLYLPKTATPIPMAYSE